MLNQIKKFIPNSIGVLSESNSTDELMPTSLRLKRKQLSINAASTVDQTHQPQMYAASPSTPLPNSPLTTVPSQQSKIPKMKMQPVGNLKGSSDSKEVLTHSTPTVLVKDHLCHTTVVADSQHSSTSTGLSTQEEAIRATTFNHGFSQSQEELVLAEYGKLRPISSRNHVVLTLPNIKRKLLI